MSVCLSVCLFVSNKRQNGWTDRAQIFCGTSRDHMEGLWMIKILNFVFCIISIFSRNFRKIFALFFFESFAVFFVKFLHFFAKFSHFLISENSAFFAKQIEAKFRKKPEKFRIFEMRKWSEMVVKNFFLRFYLFAGNPTFQPLGSCQAYGIVPLFGIDSLRVAPGLIWFW